jgi:hypothetical protein
MLPFLAEMILDLGLLEFMLEELDEVQTVWIERREVVSGLMLAILLVQ